MNLFFALGSFFPAQTGGADNAARWLVRSLSRHGYRVSVATTDSGLATGQVPTDEWIKADFGEVIYVKTWIHYLPLKLFGHAIRRALKADVVHLNALFYPISLLLALVCVPMGKRVVWSIHGELAPEALKISPVRKRLFLKVIGLLSQRVTFHATNESERTYVLNTFGPATRTVLIPLYLELPDRQPHRPTNPYLLFLGRLHPIKALDRLLQALSQTAVFCGQPWSLKVVGIGEPAYERSLKTLTQQLGLADKVEFVGFRDGSEKYDLMANAYLTLLPSHTENFSMVVVESLAQATPVLASVYTPWQTLVDHSAGWWVDNTPDALAKALTEALSLSPGDYQRYRENAWKLAVGDYDIERHIGRWEAVYQPVSASVPA